MPAAFYSLPSSSFLSPFDARCWIREQRAHFRFESSKACSFPSYFWFFSPAPCLIPGRSQRFFCFVGRGSVVGQTAGRVHGLPHPRSIIHLSCHRGCQSDTVVSYRHPCQLRRSPVLSLAWPCDLTDWLLIACRVVCALICN